MRNICVARLESLRYDQTQGDALPRSTIGDNDGVGGFGLSLEFAVPRRLLLRKIDYSGVGIDIGVLRDKKGFGFYLTTKTTMQTSVAGALQLEGFSALRREIELDPIDRMDLDGSGYETSLGLGNFGISYATDNNADEQMMPDYHMFTMSGGVGLPVEYVNWNTKTYVSGKRKF